MIVAYDCDGVLYNLEDTLALCVPAHRVGPPPETWDFYHTWDNMTTQEFGDYIAQGVRDKIMFWTGEPYPDALESVNAVKAAGHTVIILTHRGVFGEGEELAKEATAHWLDSAGFLYDDVILTPDKTSVYSDFMIDDKIDNVLALEAAGTEAWVRDRPWNRELNWPRRAFTLADYTKAVLAAGER